VPDPFLGDIVLFLHLVPMIAALAVLPHLREDERDERIRMLDFTLLLTWWVSFMCTQSSRGKPCRSTKQRTAPISTWRI
jgi:hypothetical protein